MAKKRKRRRRASIVSNVTSGIAWLIALVPFLKNVRFIGNPEAFAQLMVLDYTGYDFKAGKFTPQALAGGWVPLIGAIAFKMAMSQLARRARIRF